MLAFRTIDYQEEESPEKVFSRLTWDTERVNNLWSQLIVSNTVATKRKWVGVLDGQHLKFDLLEPRGFFSFKPFHIVVSGTISKADDKTAINIKFKPGWFMLYFLTAIYIATIIMAVSLPADWSNNPENLISAILWFSVFPGLGTYLAYRKLNKIQNRIEDTLLLNREKNNLHGGVDSNN